MFNMHATFQSTLQCHEYTFIEWVAPVVITVNIVYSLVYPLPALLSSSFSFNCFSVCPVCFKVHLSNLISRVGLLRFQAIQSIYCDSLYICVHVPLLPLIFALYILCFRWQTLVGAVLLLLSGRLGWVEMSRVSR